MKLAAVHGLCWVHVAPWLAVRCGSTGGTAVILVRASSVNRPSRGAGAGGLGPGRPVSPVQQPRKETAAWLMKTRSSDEEIGLQMAVERNSPQHQPLRVRLAQHQAVLREL